MRARHCLPLLAALAFPAVLLSAHAQPQAALAPTALAFGGQSMETTSPPQTVTVTNTGNAPLTINTITIPNANFGRTHNCTTLAPAASCTVTVTFTPEAAAGAVNATSTRTGTLNIASNGPGSPNSASLEGTAEKSLITHYYRSILRRAPDAGGKSFWAGEATRMQSIGANVNETWFSMASFFYFSSEYLALNRNDSGFVTDLYNTFFNRPPDGGGLSYWTGQLGSGMPREVVLAAFMFSTEFVTFTQAIFGNTAARAEVDVILDFYRGLLSRLPDGGGFAFWVQQFRNAQCTSSGAVFAQVESISSGFATGGEYAARNRSNAQYVGDLYNSFLRRGGDLNGVQFWINQLNTAAMTREQVRQQFIASGEFSGRVNAIVAQGCLPAPTAPSAASLPASDVTAGAATFNGQVNDNGATATVTFDFGVDPTYGNNAAATPATLGPAAGAVQVTLRLATLGCGTTYHYRVRAQNSVGTTTGADQVVTTVPCATAPTATTAAASDISASGAKLHGIVNDNRASATASFEYGLTTAYGSSVPAVPATVATGAGSTEVSASVAGLACGSTYHFGAKAVNSFGTTYGADRSFRTTECASTCPSPTVLCVSATPGPDQEFTTIQAAVDVANPGDTVLVLDGTYAGFIVTRSGTSGNPIVVKAKGTGAVVNTLVAPANEAIRVQNSSYVTIEGFTIDGLPGRCLTARGAPINTPMQGLVYRGNTVKNCTTANLYLSKAASALVENNVISGSAGAGLYFASAESDNNVVRGNLIELNQNGIVFDADAASSGGDGMQSGFTIEGNTIRQNTFNGISADGLKDSLIRNNLIEGNGVHGVRALRNGAASGPQNIRIVNNTIVVPGTAYDRAGITFTEDLGGHTFYNNAMRGVDGVIHVGNPNFKSERNVFAVFAGGFSLNGGTTIMDLAQWRAQAGGYDAASSLSSELALWVNPVSGGDFRLTGGSPAANAGVASFNGVAAPLTDILGVARPQGSAHDLGAYESF